MKSPPPWSGGSPPKAPMPLAEQRARFAEALARRRITLGFLFGAVVLWLAQPTSTTLAAGAPIAVCGEALRVWAAGHLNKATEVTSSGPYKWFAHPLYVGSSIMGAGLAVASGSVTVAVLIAAYLIATLTAAIKSEEAFLRRTFGDRYDRYRRSAATDGNAASPVRRFSVAQVRANHELRTMGGVGIAMLLLILKATYNDLFWRIAAGR
jgi:protein-S-isoprenylcysteine O-methyltransferase Ste14